MKVKKHVRLTMTFNDLEYGLLCSGLRALLLEGDALSKKEISLVATMLATMENLESELTIG